MFESIGRGFRLIWASMKMGMHDKRLLLPSLLTVVCNIFFAILLLLQAKSNFGGNSATANQFMQQGQNLLQGGNPGNLVNMTNLNGPMDPSGLGSAVTQDSVLAVTGILCTWWLCNRFLEGVTTALVYSHLTEGKGSGKFGAAAQAVLTSLPAIILLGIVTLIVKRIAGWLRNKRGEGLFGFGFNFLAGIIEVFWTLAGHMILPAIVIEGTSFWGALKRADRIAQGNLLTIGVGEVGVDVICKVVSYVVYLGGCCGFGLAYFANNQMLASPVMIFTGVVWASTVLIVTAASIYIRAAFYTCLYVWAITAEEVEEAMRSEVAPPAPLAAALAA